MRHIYVLLLFSILISPVWAQAPDHLPDEEIAAAVTDSTDIGFSDAEDMGVTNPNSCQAQMPSASVFTPTGWIRVQSQRTKRMHIPSHPTEEDTLRVLTIISKGRASGTSFLPVCDTINRVAHSGSCIGPVSAIRCAQTWNRC